ncbi:MAG: hypothetical protein QOF20_2352 [Acidimicrobiaceae bacterium]|nr:hypothetical protein [Acidimicrobiaceae bacterium]
MSTLSSWPELVAHEVAHLVHRVLDLIGVLVCEVLRLVGHQTGYEPFGQSIAGHTTDFARPVLLFNGNSHIHRSDHPLSPGALCISELARPARQRPSCAPATRLANAAKQGE